MHSFSLPFSVLVLSNSWTVLWLTNTTFHEFVDSFSPIQNDISLGQKINPRPSASVKGGHWEYSLQKIPRYNNSEAVCNQTAIHIGDCKNVANCFDDLMSWQFVTSDNTPYPIFDVDGFRRDMKHKQILFIGDSTVRQQVLALAWTLGLDYIDWKRGREGMINTQCATDPIGNITICR